MPKHPGVVNLSKFQGINNTELPENTDPSYLKEAINIDISKKGDVTKRLGFQKVKSGTRVHSIWGNELDCYYVNDGELRYLYKGYDVKALDTGIGNNRVDYLYLNGSVYYTSRGNNGTLTGDERKPFGIETPNLSPTLIEGAGSLYEGQYQVSLSYVDVNGLESGSRLATAITVGDGASIHISNIPVSSDPLVAYVRLYMSTTNGEVLYIAKDVSNGATTAIIHNDRNLITPNETISIDTPPLGDLISYFEGSVLIADGRTLWFSEPYTPTWFKTSKNFYQFDSEITMLMPLESGVYVGLGNRVVWLSGNSVEDLSAKEKEICKPVKYSNVKIPSGYIVIDNTPLGPKWLFTSDEGMYVCMENGVMFNVTAKNVSFPSADEGVGMFMQNDGINKYISLLKDQNSDGQNMAVGDLVTAEVIRNGIVIP